MRNFVIILIGLFLASCARNYDTPIAKQTLSPSGVEANSIFKNNAQKEQVLSYAQNYQELIKMYKKQLSLNDSPENRYALAKYYYLSDDFLNADFYLKPLSEIDYSVSVLLLQAKIYKAQNKMQLALTSAKNALILDKDDQINETYISDKSLLSKVYNLGGAICASNADFVFAKELFMKSKKFFGDDNIVDVNLGVLEILQENYKTATEYLMPLYIRGSKDVTLLNNLSLALAKDKQTKKAQDLVSIEGLSENPSSFVSFLENLDVKETYLSKSDSNITSLCQDLNKL